MKPLNQESYELRTLISDHMENGFLDNIISLYKQDKVLYSLIGDLIQDERIRVRIGISALIETLSKEDPDNISNAVPGILPLLKNPNPVLRGDAAYLLGVIGDKELIPSLQEVLNSDKNPDVITIAKEAIEEINSEGI